MVGQFSCELLGFRETHGIPYVEGKPTLAGLVLVPLQDGPHGSLRLFHRVFGHWPGAMGASQDRLELVPLPVGVDDVALLDFENRIAKLRVDYHEVRLADGEEIIVLAAGVPERGLQPVLIPIKHCVLARGLCMRSKT